jgi:hypothetical protein
MHKTPYYLMLNVGGRFLGNVSDSSTLTPGIHLDGGVGYMFNPIWGIKGDLRL